MDLNTAQEGVYFSIDGGVTSLRVYNNGSNGGDDKDWASGLNPPFDSFNAFTGSGNMQPLSLADKLSMDVMGYNLVPEPSSLVLAGLGCIALVAQCRHRRQIQRAKLRDSSARNASRSRAL